jgi:hypothetical protein
MRKLLLLAALLPLTALAETATLSWTAPTQDTAGRPLAPGAVTSYTVAWSWEPIPADVAGATLVHVEGALSKAIDVNVPPDGGTFHARVNACAGALCSDYTAEVTKVFPPKPVVPTPPTSVTIVFR